jgi:hypothetical protein
VTKRAQNVVDDIKSLPDTEKLAVVDSILLELDRPDPEIDRVWANEARARWQAYRTGRAEITKGLTTDSRIHRCRTESVNHDEH